MFGITRSPIDFESSWLPNSSGGLLQRILDASPTYHASTVGGYPILTPEETGTVAQPRGQRCVLFDGSNDYGTLGARLTSGSVTALTVCFFACPSSITNQMTFMQEVNHSANEGWLCNSNSGDKSAVNCYFGASGAFGTTPTGVLSANTWKHLAFVYDGSQSGNSNRLKCYVDGAAVTLTFTGTIPASIPSHANVFEIGRYSSISQVPLSGKLYAVRVYNVAKSPTEIAAIFNQASTPSTIDTTGLLGMWPLQEESGTTAYDCSGNGKHLTLTSITQATFHAVDSGVTHNINNWKGYTVANNLLTYSEQFDNAAWVKFNTTISANTVAAPNGSVTADSLLETTATGAHITTQNLTLTPGSRYTVSVYARGINRTRLYIGASNNADTNGTGGIVDLVGVQVGVAPSAYGTGYTAGALSASAASNGFTRLAFSFTAVDSTTKITIAIDAGTGTGAGVTSYAGNAANGVYLWGAELEPGDTAGTYFPTTSTVLTNVIIPASLSTPSQDAAGNALGVAGPVAHPATMEVPCVTGDGAAVHINLGSALIPAMGDFAVNCQYFQVAAGSEHTIFDQRNSTATSQITLIANRNGGAVGSGAITLFCAGQTIVSTITPGWHAVAVTRVGSVFSLFVDGLLVGTATSALSIDTGQSTHLLVLNNPSKIMYSSGRICDLRITTGGVTTYFPLQDGPGTSNTNRDLAYCKSDGTGGVVSNAIVNGTVANIWANRCPYARSHCVEYGGGVAANGAFVPGLIGGANDAAGNAKTLSAGKHGNPYSRLCPNTFSAPELVNIGYTASTKLAPSDAVQSISPVDSKFRRNKTTGSDRYLAYLAALTGSNKTNAESYTG